MLLKQHQQDCKQNLTYLDVFPYLQTKGIYRKIILITIFVNRFLFCKFYFESFLSSYFFLKNAKLPEEKRSNSTVLSFLNFRWAFNIRKAKCLDKLYYAEFDNLLRQMIVRTDFGKLVLSLHIFKELHTFFKFSYDSICIYFGKQLSLIVEFCLNYE